MVMPQGDKEARRYFLLLHVRYNQADWASFKVLLWVYYPPQPWK